MINPDVQNSSAPHRDHTVINISELKRVLAQEFATHVKVHNDNCCPIYASFFALLDSHLLKAAVSH